MYVCTYIRISVWKHRVCAHGLPHMLKDFQGNRNAIYRYIHTYICNIYNMYIYSSYIGVLTFQKEIYTHKLINTQCFCVYLCIKSHLLHICTSQNHKTNSRYQHWYPRPEFSAQVLLVNQRLNPASVKPTCCSFHHFPKLITSTLLGARTRLLFNKQENSMVLHASQAAVTCIMQRWEPHHKIGKKRGGAVSLPPLQKKGFQRDGQPSAQALGPLLYSENQQCI